METIIGFAAGYLAGSKDGPDGLRRLRTTLRDILTSTETRRLTREALTIAEGIARQVTAGRTLSGTVESVTDMLTQRSAISPDRAA